MATVKTELKAWEVTIWNTVDMLRDSDKDEPEVEQHTFIVEADNENDAYEKAQKLHFDKTKKGVWESEINDYEEPFNQFNNFSNWTEEMLNSPFVAEYNKAVEAGELTTSLMLNIACTKRDLSMWAKHKMKPHRHWRVSDVKWYFGIKGNGKNLLEQYLIIFYTINRFEEVENV